MEKIENNNIYNVYLYERKAICPVCSGAMEARMGTETYKCIDCGSSFRVVDFSNAEDYMRLKKI